MDGIDLKILEIIQDEGRITMKELGQRVGLTSPATIERVKKLEENGVISGYRAVINIAEAGLPVCAFITITLQGQPTDAIVQFACTHEGILECHRLAGQASYLLKAAVADLQRLEQLLDALAPLGKTTTHIVLSTAFEHKAVVLP